MTVEDLSIFVDKKWLLEKTVGEWNTAFFELLTALLMAVNNKRKFTWRYFVCHTFRNVPWQLSSCKYLESLKNIKFIWRRMHLLGICLVPKLGMLMRWPLAIMWPHSPKVSYWLERYALSWLTHIQCSRLMSSWSCWTCERVTGRSPWAIGCSRSQPLGPPLVMPFGM